MIGYEWYFIMRLRKVDSNENKTCNDNRRLYSIEIEITSVLSDGPVSGLFGFYLPREGGSTPRSAFIPSIGC